MDIQGTLGRSRAVANMDCFLTRLEEKLDDFPRGFNLLYNSPLYEGRTSLCNSTTYEGFSTRGNPARQISPKKPDMSLTKESQIRELETEISQLRDELQRRETNSRANSPTMKSVFPSLPQSTTFSIPPAPPPIAPSDSIWPIHLTSDFEATTTDSPRDPLQLNRVSKRHSIQFSPEVIVKDREPMLSDCPLEEMKTVTTQATQNGMWEYANRLEPSDYFSTRRAEVDMDNRSWVPSPEENRENSAAPTGIEFANCQTHDQQMDHCNGCCRDNEIMSTDMNSDEGDLQVLKAAIRKLSHIFREQEGKIDIFKGEPNQEDADSSQPLHLRHLYLELLKGMSQQLGELCRDLQSKTRSHEKLDQNCMRMEMIDQPDATLHPDSSKVAQQTVVEENASFYLKDRFESGAGKLFKVVEDHMDEISSESTNLIAALKAAEREIEKQMSTNLLLTEKLDSGARYLSKVMEMHAEEVMRKDQRISYAQQLNIHLANHMSQAEASLSELQSHYKDLVSNLELQLEAARKEAVNLQETVSELKVEIARKESLVSNLERETKEHELQVEELRGQMQATQGETSAIVQENVGLTKRVEAMQKEVDRQHYNVKEVISINENLIEFSQNKEDEIKVLTRTVRSLQQSVDEKSDDAAKMSANALKFSQEVVEARKEGEAYRSRYAALKSKLEETERELLAREDSIETLKQHLNRIIEGQDSLCEEKEQTLLSFNKAHYKEYHISDHVRESRRIIQDLEEKLNSMDADIYRANLEMADAKAKAQEALAIERQDGRRGRESKERMGF